MKNKPNINNIFIVLFVCILVPLVSLLVEYGNYSNKSRSGAALMRGEALIWDPAFIRGNTVFAKSIVIRNGKIVWKVVWIGYYLQLNLSSEDTSTQATSAYVRCKQWMCWKVSMVKTTVLFTCDQLLGALIHFNFIILILICFWLMMSGVNYVIYGCSSARTTPEVSLFRSFLTLEENIVAVITQNREIDDNFERQIKNQTLCTFSIY